MSIGSGVYIFLIDGQLVEFNHIDNLPAEFDHVIKFAPEMPPHEGDHPHTEEEHAIIDGFNAKLQELLEIERARSNARRGR